MGTVRRAVKNFLSLSAAQIMSQAILFLTIIYLARTLGAAAFGKIAFAQAVVLYFALIANLGLTTLGVREVARDKDRIDNYIGNILSLRLVLALLSFFLLFIFVSLIKKPTEVKYLIILFGLSLFPSALLLDWLFQGVEKMGSIGISRILDKLFYAGLIFLLVKDAKHIWVVPCLWLGGSLLASGFLVYVFTRQFGRPRLRFNLSFWKELARRALPMGAAFIMIQIYYNLDTVMLGFMRNDEVVGWYTAAYKVVLFVWAFIPIFINVIFPLMSKYYQQSKEKLKLVISSATKLMSTIA
ncbi:flippase, partial [Candidatus Aerophobetes bacterium]